MAVEITESSGMIPELFRPAEGVWYMVSDARTDFAMLCSLLFCPRRATVVYRSTHDLPAGLFQGQPHERFYSFKTPLP
jgi:hypothetical protein